MLFEVTKASENYRFEYLYVDALGLANPADVTAILVSKNAFGFLVDLVGSPSTVGYVLRWRAVVIDLTTLSDVDTPESLRVPIPAGVRTLTVTWTTPRSGSTYGFTELRVENLVDVLADQRIISVQVGVKTNGSFTIGLNPPAIGVNYYLIARSP